MDETNNSFIVDSPMVGSVVAAQKSCRDWIKQTSFFCHGPTARNWINGVDIGVFSKGNRLKNIQVQGYEMSYIIEEPNPKSRYDSIE